MKKLSSYQKLKAQNEQFKKDIYQMVMTPDTIDGQMVAAAWRIIFEIDNSIWLGEETSNV